MGIFLCHETFQVDCAGRGIRSVVDGLRMFDKADDDEVEDAGGAFADWQGIVCVDP